MRVLDEAHIPYSVRTYKVDAEHLDALSVAQMINLEPRQVCKTIVCRNERAKILLFCVPGGMKIDLKGAAS
ncbi:MAG: Cys-tRNA(Pro) deacylase, partial [Sphaerochaetaceae bacterium]